MPNFVSYEDFARDPIFQSLETINDFSLIVELAPLVPVNDDAAVVAATRLMYQHLHGVLGDAGFFAEYLLKPFREGETFGVRFDDDMYGFRIACTERSIVINRLGSTFAKFHDWYNRFIPLAQSIILPMVSHFGRAAGVDENHSLGILRGSYQFEFICFDIVPLGRKIEVRNSEIMKSVLRQWPDETGSMTDDPGSLSTVSRVDVNLHRWTGIPGRRRLERYNVEAPANDQGSSLWFTFEYRGESYESPESGMREQWDAIPFLNEWDAAYRSFLRDRAICGFMASVLRADRFKTTSSRLP